MVFIYINNNILLSGQLQHYVALMSGNFTQIPDKAKNIIQNKKSSKKKTKTSVPIIPILILNNYTTNYTTNNTKDKKLLKEILNDVINTDDPNKNLNPPEITKLLKEQFCNNDSILIEFKNLSKIKKNYLQKKILK